MYILGRSTAAAAGHLLGCLLLTMAEHLCFGSVSSLVNMWCVFRETLVHNYGQHIVLQKSLVLFGP